MPSSLVVGSYFFFFLSIFVRVYSENTTEASSASICLVQPSVLELKPAVNHPFCSLSSQPAEPAPEFLSFEEWKAKRLAGRDESSREKDGHPATTSHVAGSQQGAILQNETQSNTNKSGNPTDGVSHNDTPPTTAEHSVTGVASPRSHIPLIDRFNYASNECNARIQKTHKSAKSAASILSRKKDRYMLSPCQTNKEKHFVIIELCEDIRIDTVQLANFEFFSGVFKDIRVSAAHTYTSDGQGWTVVGEYTAKNIRGIQSFHPQKELLPFYRYIRIDFLSYYGSEHFCPVSLLRVYGLTQMEEWKSDVWKAEWDGSRIDSEPVSEPVSEPSVITLEGRSMLSKTDAHPETDHTESPVVITTETHLPNSADPAPIESLDFAVPETAAVEHTMTATPDISVIGISTTTAEPVKEAHVPPVENVNTASPITSASYSDRKDEADAPVVHPVDSTLRAPQSTDIEHTYAHTKEDDSASATSIEVSSTPSVTTSSASSSSPIESPHTIIRTVSTTIVLSAATPSASTHSVIPSGESIYRMIINRLNGLETNQTLYAKYFEEQGKIVNVRMERLEEDIGRLGAIVTSQQQQVSKMLEKHRDELDYKHEQLALQVENLAHEVLMEKRIGIAQLVILLTVLVFMTLTRGSRGEPIRFSRAGAALHRGMQSSGDWVASWRGSRPFSGSDDILAAALQPNGPPVALQPAFQVPAMKERPSFDRSRRSSSSRRSHIYDDIFQTPPRRSRNPVRSRQSSLRSRADTPARPIKTKDSSTFHPDSSPDKASRSIPVPIKSKSSGISLPGSTGNWRTGRSISLSGAKGLSGPFGGSTSNLPSNNRPHGTKKLAKTAHMHEVKNRSRRGTVDSVDANLPLLSPMMEDMPGTAMSAAFSDRGKENILMDKLNRVAAQTSPLSPEAAAAQSDGIVSTGVSATGSNLQSPNVQGLGIRIPFPSPGPEGDFHQSDGDSWIDDNDAENHPPRSPTSKTRRIFASPRRSFIFSSSPTSTKGRFKRRSDAASAALPSAGVE